MKVFGDISEGMTTILRKEAVPFYAFRKVINAEEIVAWAKDNGFATTLPADDLHVTIVFSRRPYEYESYYSGTVVAKGGNRFIQRLNTATVLTLDSPDLVEEWNFHRRMGASWDHAGYTPHVTLSYDETAPTDIPPFTGDVVLGPTQWSPFKDDWKEQIIERGGLSSDLSRANLSSNMGQQTDISSSVDVIKMDEERRVVWGWASVATEDGEPVYDSHGDHIPMEELEKASVDFMLDYRVGKREHVGDKVSEVICLMPLSKQMGDALGIVSKREGLIVGYKVWDDETWKMIKSGELGALSIGGRGIRVEQA